MKNVFQVIGFRSLQTYMVLKQQNPRKPLQNSFRSLQTYMVLKHRFLYFQTHYSFRSLQTYMVLKLANDVLVVKEVLDPYKLTWFSNLSNLILNRPCFRSLQTYMVLKHLVYDVGIEKRFRSLQTYMVLKPQI